MHILEIILYGKNGLRRILSLRIGTNIITGKSSTGKTALIEIVEYCLGKSTCTVPEGVIRERVDWFALKLQFPSKQVLVARKNPEIEMNSSSEVYFEVADTIETPLKAPTRSNTTVEALVESLSQMVRISPNLEVPAPRPDATEGSAKIKHALFYCFQKQTEIATNQILFHRQATQGMFPTIRNMLPFFLGAVAENYLAKKQELVNARRDLATLERRLGEAQSIHGEGVDNAHALLEELKETGIVASDVTASSLSEYVAIFRENLSWQPANKVFPGSERIPQLQHELAHLRQLLSEKASDLRVAEKFADEAKGFKRELEHQEKRLESIRLFDTDEQDNEHCPICMQKMDRPLPATNEIRHAIAKVKENLELTTREEPQLLEYIQRLETEINGLKEQIRLRTNSLNYLIQQHEESQHDQDTIATQMKVIGHMEYWLKNLRTDSDSEPLQLELKRISELVNKLEAEVDEEYEKERLRSTLNRINTRMTELSKQLDFEFAGVPIRLDPTNLTILVDTPKKPVPLASIGSGRNWLAYHLLVYFTLQEYFIENDRPVPRFLFLDQPSQVYFPRDSQGELLSSLSLLKNEDREAVLKMYQFIISMVESLHGQLQVVVTDHAELSDPFFQAHIVENWHNDNALIPLDWIKDDERQPLS